jgi:polyphosphate kinase 2 (PPK2 family)
LTNCSTAYAPWHIVPANQKWYRNYVVSSIVADALKRLKMKYPQPDLSNVTVE